MKQPSSRGWLESLIPGSKALLPASVLTLSLGLAACGSDSDSNGSSNTAPEISGSVNTLTEGSVDTSTVVASLTATDPDDDELTFEITGDDAAYFEISGTNVLLTAAGVTAINDDDLGLTSVSFDVAVSDGSLTATTSLTVSVTRIDGTSGNNAPALSTSFNALTEDSVDISTIVAVLTGSDADNDALTYRLTGDGAAYFELSGTNVVLSEAGVAAINDDALNLTTLSLTVTVSDGTDSASQTVEISIIRIDDSEPARYIKLFEDDFEADSVDKWNVVSVSGELDWHTESFSGDLFAVANCYQGAEDCDDWMITPALPLTTFESAAIQFESAWSFGDETAAEQVRLKVSTDFDGTDVAAATWTDISDRVVWSAGDFVFTDSGEVSLTDFVGQDVYVAFHYVAAKDSGVPAKWEIDDVLIDGQGTGDFPLQAEIVVAGEVFYSGREITFNSLAVNGAGEPFTYAWDFGDAETSEEESPTHEYDLPGRYEVSLTVTDSDDNEVSTSLFLDVEAETRYSIADKNGDLRVASFNAGFDLQDAAGEQNTAFAGGDYRKAQKVAEIIQRVQPDVLLLNEIDGNDAGATVNTFKTDYLEVAQAEGLEAISYDHVYYGDNGDANYCNTGAPIEEDVDVDFNKDGDSDDPEDRYGFGHYNGQYCMVIFSKYPIDTANARTFAKFKWQDMPDYLVPTVDGDNYYTEDEMSVFRLSSKTHIDLPVNVDGTVVHILATHPTPPVFDGDEDRNGLRNFDEIRLFADYIDPGSDYLYDDQGNQYVTLADQDRFVILGDLNASAVEGDAAVIDEIEAIEQLLLSPYVNPNLHEGSVNFQVPTSVAGTENAPSSLYGATHTASWRQRADYVLPSSYGLKIEQGGVYWPQYSDDLYYLINAVDGDDIESSDHRLVWMDLTIFEGTVEAPATEVLNLVDEVSIDQATFDATFEVVEGPGNFWAASSRDGLEFAEANCFTSDVDCDSWLIYSLDLTDVQTPVFFMDVVNQYALGGLTIKVSTDHVTGEDPANASWETLEVDLPASVGWDWVELDLISMGDVGGEANVSVAFHYEDNFGSGAALWRIDNLVFGDLLDASEPLVLDYLNVDSVTFEEAFTLIEGEGFNWGASERDGVEYAEANCFNSEIDCDSWLIYDADLSGTINPELAFVAINQYAAGGLTVLASTDYVAGDDPETATWDTLDVSFPTSQSWDWVTVDGISLQQYAGFFNLSIAFHYEDNFGSGAALWRIDSISITEEPLVDQASGTGETILADVAPTTDALNQVNQRAQGTLVFDAVEAPATPEEEVARIGSAGVTINDEAIDNSGYKTLMKSGDLIDGSVYGQIKDKNGTDLFVSNYNEFTSFLPIDDRLFAVSQFESIPGGLHLVELNQDSTTGELSPVSTMMIDMSHLEGGYNHCAGIVTPWNTHLAAEEYEPDAGSRSASTGEIDSFYDQIEQYHGEGSLLSVNPYWYGYPVEVAVSIQDSEAAATVVKHYAAGRMSIEVPYVMPDRRTMYLTDDGTNGGLYMFVADEAEDLSSGHLYAMKWDQTDAGSDDNAGMGAADISWISLGHATSDEVEALITGDDALEFSDIFEKVEDVDGECPLGYSSINHKGSQECLNLKDGMELAASRLETRRYAALMGATVEMRKEEGFTYNPHNHKAYMAISDIARGMLNGNSRDAGGENHMRLSEENSCGGIYELALGSNDEIGSEFVVGQMAGLIAGVEHGSACDIDGLAGPDNVAYVGYNTLIITEDTDDHANNFVWAYDLEADSMTRIFSAPTGAENTGPYMFHNINGFAYITNVVQHPAGERVDPQAGNEAELV